MADKTLPFGTEALQPLLEQYPTPFHIYDEAAIRENARALKAAFAWNEGFREYFAVKATPNPYLVKLLKAEGFGLDCSSMAELVLAHGGPQGAGHMGLPHDLAEGLRTIFTREGLVGHAAPLGVKNDGAPRRKIPCPGNLPYVRAGPDLVFAGKGTGAGRIMLRI